MIYLVFTETIANIFQPVYVIERGLSEPIAIKISGNPVIYP